MANEWSQVDAALQWLARFGVVAIRQFRQRTQLSASTVDRIRRAGLVNCDRVYPLKEPVVRISASGIRAVGADFRPPRLDIGRVRHSVAVVDVALWLAGDETSKVWQTEREIRRDRARASRTFPFGPMRRTPDGILVDGTVFIAVEVDLTPKRTGKLRLLANAYAADTEISQVLWLLPSAAASARMDAEVTSLALGGLIRTGVLTCGQSWTQY